MNTMTACAAAERSAARALRVTSSSLLIFIAVVECSMASLMVARNHSLPNLAFLLCTLALFAGALISLRNAADRALLLVQSAVAAALLALFWASGNQVHGGPSVTIGHSKYEVTLTLAGLLFIALLLARLLRRSPEQACKCG